MEAVGCDVAWAAYVDESMRIRRDGAGVYVLAGAVLDDIDADATRRDLAALVAGRRRRVHWRDADDLERRRLVATVGDMQALHMVVVGTQLNPRQQERGRRHCLRRLLWELENSGVGRVLMESRTQSLNGLDRVAIQGWRAQHLISGNLMVDFAKPYGPSGEPLLWLPDIVAGAVSAAHSGGDQSYRKQLQPILTELAIDLSH
jgi:hypothetical protein